MFERERSDGRAEPVRGESSSGIRLGRTAFHSPRPARSQLVRRASFSALLSFAAVLGLWRWEDARFIGGSGNEAQAPATEEVAVAFAERSDRLLDPTPLAGSGAPKFGPAVSEG